MNHASPSMSSRPPAMLYEQMHGQSKEALHSVLVSWYTARGIPTSRMPKKSLHPLRMKECIMAAQNNLSLDHFDTEEKQDQLVSRRVLDVLKTESFPVQGFYKQIAERMHGQCNVSVVSEILKRNGVCFTFPDKLAISLLDFLETDADRRGPVKCANEACSNLTHKGQFQWKEASLCQACYHATKPERDAMWMYVKELQRKYHSGLGCKICGCDIDDEIQMSNVDLSARTPVHRDHRRLFRKLGDTAICTLIKHGTTKELLDQEFDKCRMLCAPHHSVQTHMQQNLFLLPLKEMIYWKFNRLLKEEEILTGANSPECRQIQSELEKTYQQADLYYGDLEDLAWECVEYVQKYRSAQTKDTEQYRAGREALQTRMEQLLQQRRTQPPESEGFWLQFTQYRGVKREEAEDVPVKVEEEQADFDATEPEQVEDPVTRRALAIIEAERELRKKGACSWCDAEVKETQLTPLHLATEMWNLCAGCVAEMNLVVNRTPPERLADVISAIAAVYNPESRKERFDARKRAATLRKEIPMDAWTRLQVIALRKVWHKEEKSKSAKKTEDVVPFEAYSNGELAWSRVSTAPKRVYSSHSSVHPDILDLEARRAVLARCKACARTERQVDLTSCVAESFCPRAPAWDVASFTWLLCVQCRVHKAQLENAYGVTSMWAAAQRRLGADPDSLDRLARAWLPFHHHYLQIAATNVRDVEFERTEAKAAEKASGKKETLWKKEQKDAREAGRKQENDADAQRAPKRLKREDKGEAEGEGEGGQTTVKVC